MTARDGRTAFDPMLYAHTNGIGEHLVGRVVALADGGFGITAKQQRAMDSATCWYIVDPSTNRIVCESEATK